MMPDKWPLPESKPNSIRLSCPVCNRIVLPLPGHSVIQALEGHLVRDHWYPGPAAHDAASDAFNKRVQ